MEASTLEPVLAKHPFFQNLEARHLRFLAGCASNVRFEAGRMIGREGEAADHFYLLRQGQVAVETYAPPRGAITIQTLGEGEILGWSWLIPPHRWRFGARALQPVSALALDGKCLRGKMEEDHDLGYALLKRFSGVMVNRLEATRLQLLDVYGNHG